VAHLRYPSARETSAALLRVLAQGRPTLVSDLEHQSELPDDVVLRIDVANEDDALEAGPAAARRRSGAARAAVARGRRVRGARARAVARRGGVGGGLRGGPTGARSRPAAGVAEALASARNLLGPASL
jgi:hypothetical protein